MPFHCTTTKWLRTNEDKLQTLFDPRLLNSIGVFFDPDLPKIFVDGFLETYKRNSYPIIPTNNGINLNNLDSFVGILQQSLVFLRFSSNVNRNSFDSYCSIFEDIILNNSRQGDPINIYDPYFFTLPGNTGMGDNAKFRNELIKWVNGNGSIMNIYFADQIRNGNNQNDIQAIHSVLRYTNWKVKIYKYNKGFHNRYIRFGPFGRFWLQFGDSFKIGERVPLDSVSLLAQAPDCVMDDYFKPFT